MTEDWAVAVASGRLSRRELLCRAGYGGLALSASGLVLSACGGDEDEVSATSGGGVTGSYEIPQVTLTLGLIAAGDQLIAVDGIRNGWFKDVGIAIEPEPFGVELGFDQMVPLVINGEVQIATVWTPTFMQSMASAPELRVVGFVDTFVGTMLLAAPEVGAQPLESFMNQGEPFSQAMQSAVGQIRGKRLAIDDTANNIVFDKTVIEDMGGVPLNETDLSVVADPRIVQLAIGQQIDFARAAGAAQTVRLLELGWERVVGLQDILEFGPPGIASHIIGNSGWGTTEEFATNNKDTILRFLSVIFRVIDHIHASPDDALQNILPVLEGRVGGEVGVEGLKRVIFDLDPLTSFEDQSEYWTDDESGYFFENLYAGQLASYQESGVLPKDEEFEPSDVIIGATFYQELVSLKDQYEELQPRAAQLSGERASELVAAATKQYEARNYLDAAGMLEAALS